MSLAPRRSSLVVCAAALLAFNNVERALVSRLQELRAQKAIAFGADKPRNA